MKEAVGQPVRTDFTDLPFMPADKIGISVNNMADISALSKFIPKNTYIEMSDPNGVIKLGLIMNKRATKLNGIKTLSKHFGINLKDIIAFGDDYNDIQMLRSCGIGVAMDNAIVEVKAVANYITDTNDNDGVAKWLDENLLQRGVK